MSVNCCLNNKNFAITILNNKQTHKSGFRCLCDGKDSGIQQSVSAAINNTYNQVFGNKTEYSEMAIISFDDEAIVNELLADILFISIFIHLNARILIVVSQIDISFCESYCDADSGYLSTLITKYKNK